MAVMTIPQVKEARIKAYKALEKHGYDPNLQIKSKEEFIQVAQDVFSDIRHERPGVIGLRVYNGTGGMFVSLLERIRDDALRAEIIKEVNQDDRSPNRRPSASSWPPRFSARPSTGPRIASPRKPPGCSTDGPRSGPHERGSARPLHACGRRRSRQYVLQGRSAERRRRDRAARLATGAAAVDPPPPCSMRTDTAYFGLSMGP